jgi:hypothetical protein
MMCQAGQRETVVSAEQRLDPNGGQDKNFRSMRSFWKLISQIFGYVGKVSFWAVQCWNL